MILYMPPILVLSVIPSPARHLVGRNPSQLVDRRLNDGRAMPTISMTGRPPDRPRMRDEVGNIGEGMNQTSADEYETSFRLTINGLRLLSFERRLVGTPMKFMKRV